MTSATRTGALASLFLVATACVACSADRSSPSSQPTPTATESAGRPDASEWNPLLPSARALRSYWANGVEGAEAQVDDEVVDLGYVAAQITTANKCFIEPGLVPDLDSALILATTAIKGRVAVLDQEDYSPEQWDAVGGWTPPTVTPTDSGFRVEFFGRFEDSAEGRWVVTYSNGGPTIDETKVSFP